METRRNEIENELHEIDGEIYRNEDLLVVWKKQRERVREAGKAEVENEITRIENDLQELQKRRAILQKQWEETPETQAARRVGGQFGSFIRKLQQEGRLPQD